MTFNETWIFASGGDNQQQIFDYDGSNHLIYQGWAQPGQATSASVWRIRKLTYSGDNVTNIQFPSGSPAFAYVWDDRVSLSYS